MKGFAATRFAVFCAILAFAGLAQPAFSQELTTAQILAKLDEKAKVFTSVQASIKNQGVNFGVKQPEQSGKLTIAKVKDTPRIFFDITEPTKMRTLVDKGKGTVYYPDDNTYRDAQIDPNGEQLQYLLIGWGASSASISKGYKAEARGREMIGSVNAVVLELTSIAKSTDAYPLLKLWLDPQLWVPVQTRVGQSVKTYNDFKYSNVQLNKSVSESVFDLKMKSDARKQ